MTVSTRRSFLKWGAAVAAPLAVTAAAPALAADDTAERLARLEDMEAIRALHASYIRAINTGRHDEARTLFADPAKAQLDANLRRIVLDHDIASSPAKRGRGTMRSMVEGADAAKASPDGAMIALSGDRQTATLRAACTAHTETAIDSNCTLVQMARLQGEGFVRAVSARKLDMALVRTEDGAWTIARVTI